MTFGAWTIHERWVRPPRARHRTLRGTRDESMQTGAVGSRAWLTAHGYLCPSMAAPYKSAALIDWNSGWFGVDYGYFHGYATVERGSSPMSASV